MLSRVPRNMKSRCNRMLLAVLFCSFATQGMRAQEQGGEDLLAPSFTLTKTATVTSIPSGVWFTFSLTYGVASTSQPATAVVITDVLPPELSWAANDVQMVGNAQVASTVFDPVTGTVEFYMIDPLPAGSSGVVEINVKFPAGVTPDGTLACNSATIGGSNAATVSSNDVCVTAEAQHRFTFVKDWFAGGTLDQHVIFRLRVTNPAGNDVGGLDLTQAVIKDVLPPGAVFVDAQPWPTSVSGTSMIWDLSTLVVAPSFDPEYIDIFLTVVFPSSAFNVGSVVCNDASLIGMPVGQQQITESDTACIKLVDGTHGGQCTFIGQPMNNTVVGCVGEYRLEPRNVGTIPLEQFVVVDQLPSQVKATRVTTGQYYNYPTSSVTIRYLSHLNPSWSSLGPQPVGTTIDVYTASGFNLAPNDYLTAVAWGFGTVPVGFAAMPSNPPSINYTLLGVDFLTGQPVVPGTVVNNCNELTYSVLGTSYGPLQTCIAFTVSAGEPELSTWKSLLTAGPYYAGATIRFRLTCYNVGTDDLLNPVVVDVLPPEFQYAGNVTYSSLNGAPNPGTLNPVVTVNGQTITWTFASPFTHAACDASPYGFVIEFDAVIDPNVVPGTICNNFTFGGSNVPAPVTSNTVCITINGNATLESEKLIRGAMDVAFTTLGSTVGGGALDYQLTVTNTGNVAIKDIVMVDILPYLNDVGVVDWNTGRGSQWTPSLTGPVAAPPGVSVSYSTQSDPCRDDLALFGQPVGCQPASWQLYAGVAANPTSVRSLKFDFGATVLQPGQSLTFSWPMVAPVGAPVNQLACNSFAYVARRADNNAAIGPAEPQQVCAKINPPLPGIVGDYVWQDNVADGVQDPQLEPGINGIGVEIWNAGADGVAGTPDDSPAQDNQGNVVPATLTANDTYGNPGYYLFSNLPPGNYYVRFMIPTYFTVTTRYQGGNPNLDSDGDPNPGPQFAWSGVFPISAASTDLSVDLGLVPGASVDCDSLDITAVPVQGADCCWDVTFDMLTDLSAVTMHVSGPAVITSASTPPQWTGTPAGATYPTPLISFHPLQPLAGPHTAQVCLDLGSVSSNWLVVSWYNKAGELVCLDSLYVECKGISETDTIIGYKFEDANANGIHDPGENGLAGWTFTLTSAGGGRVLSAVSGADGMFRFPGVPAGVYSLNEEQREGWVQTVPSSGGYRITVPLGTQKTFPFGNDSIDCPTPTDHIGLSVGGGDDFTGPEAATPNAAQLSLQSSYFAGTQPVGFDETAPSGFSFFAHTFSGYAQPGCVVVGGKMYIRLKAMASASSDDVIAITDANGPVWVEDIADLSQTGSWSNPLSLPSQAEIFVLDLANLPPGYTGNTSILAAIASGEFGVVVADRTMVDYIRLEIDICCPAKYGEAIIGGLKFNDLNGDGVWDPTVEPTIPGWTITLDNGQTTTTDQSGAFSFAVSAPGSYTVAEAQVSSWVQTVPPSPGTYNLSVVAGDTISGLIFGNHFPAGGGGSCDSLVGMQLDTTCCVYNATLLNNIGTPVTAVHYTIIGGTLNYLTTYPCTPTAQQQTGPSSGILLFNPGCPGNITFSISATPTTASGVISMQMVVYHVTDTCKLETEWQCERAPLVRCDSLETAPFLFTGLDLSGMTFQLHNTKIPASPIISIDILPSPAPCFLQGGALIVDGVPSTWGVPYLRIPLNGSISATSMVQFNLGVDYTCGWTGSITLLVAHADGDTCSFTFGPWSANPPSANSSILAPVSMQRTVHSSAMKLRNADGQRNVRWITVETEDKADRLIAGSGAIWHGTARDADDAVLSAYLQGGREALFALDQPLLPGERSGVLHIIVERAPGASGPPVLRWTTYDERGNALHSDTASATGSVLSIRNVQPRAAAEEASLLHSFPNPARDMLTVNYQVSTSAEIVLEVHDVAGRELAVIDRGLKESGLYSVTMPVSALRPGTYYLRLRTERGQSVRSFTVVQ